MLTLLQFVSKYFNQLCLISFISILYAIYKINPYKGYGFISFEQLLKNNKTIDEKQLMLKYKFFWALIALFIVFTFSVLVIFFTHWTEI